MQRWQSKDGNLKRRMRFACRITKARIQAHRAVIIHNFSMGRMVTRTRVIVELYVYRLSCLK